MVDIFSITPNVVSTDIGTYSFLIYGGPKVGKTTLATRFDKHLLLAFEKGYSALPGVMAQPINSWAEFIKILTQLKLEANRVEAARKKARMENKESEEALMFKTIIIDIADIAYEYCENYILSRENVSSIKDIPFGAGYTMVKKEYDTRLRSISQMGYGLVLISHAAFKKEDPDDDDSINKAMPTLAKSPRLICERLVDVLGYMTVENTDEGPMHVLNLRGTEEFVAGARFKYIADKIPATEAALEKAIQDAVQKEAEEAGVEPTSAILNNYILSDGPTFEGIRESINEKITEIMSAVKDSEEKTSEKAKTITHIIDSILGVGRKLADTNPDQVDLLVQIDDALEGVI